MEGGELGRGRGEGGGLIVINPIEMLGHSNTRVVCYVVVVPSRSKVRCIFLLLSISADG